MRFLDAAMQLAQLGFAVFPLAPGSKVPAIPSKGGGKGVLDASKDLDQIRDWARRFPKANVGIACGRASGITVIDIDTNHGGMESVITLRAQKRILSPTIAVRTPSGGWHLYYRFEPGLLNSKSKLGTGIDLRTEGGYVVAPPSVLANGCGYHWHQPPLGGEVPRMPMWAVQKLTPPPEPIFASGKPPRDPDAALKGLIRLIEQAPGGQRNQVLFWSACRAAENGCADDGTCELLISAAASVGLSRREAWKTVHSGFKRRPR